MEDVEFIPDSLITEGEISPGSSVQVVAINGRKFVTGLFWQPLSSPRSFMAEAREIGKKRSWDIVAIRRSLRIQAGFVSKDAGALKGMYSLAAALAGQLGSSWIGAFALEDGQYAVVAVHDGSIVPGYDLVVPREEAIETLQSGYNLFQFDPDSIYAPSDFNFSPHEKNIYELLTPKSLRTEYKLKQLTFGLTKRELVTVSMIFIAALMAFWGWGEYNDYQKRIERDERIQQEQIRRAQLDKLNQNSKQKQQIQALAHPWASAPAATDFVTGCSTTVHSLPLSVAGWVFESATCDNKGVSIVYKRRVAGTTVKHFAQAAPVYFDSEPAFADEGDTALVGKPLQIPFGGDDVLEPSASMLTEFTAHFQSSDTKLKLEEKQVAAQSAPPLAGQVQTPSPPAPTWRHFTFEYNAALPPGPYFVSLPHKNGIRVTQIKVKLGEEDASLAWTVSGDLYAKL